MRFKIIFLILAIYVTSSRYLYADEKTSIGSVQEGGESKNLPLKVPKSLQFGAMIDTYYLHNNNLPRATERKYTTQAVRNNEFNLNLAFVEAVLKEEKYRGRLAFQFGTSVNKNYSSEPNTDISSNQTSVRNIQEAFVGFKIGKKTWIDAGIYLGHIGFESWISHSNWNYTRAFALDYVPYYTSGFKVTHEFTDKFTFQIHVMNGWQTITDNNRDKDIGLQWKYQLHQNLTLTFNQQVGNQSPDTERKQTRYYSNNIMEWKPLDWVSIAGSFDVGAQLAGQSLQYEPWLPFFNPSLNQFTDRPGKAYRQWYHGTFWVSFHLNPEYRLSFRVERFYDPLQVLAITGTRRGFITNGYTVTLDLMSWEPALMRFEYNHRKSADPVFDFRNGQLSRNEDVFIVACSLKI